MEIRASERPPPARLGRWLIEGGTPATPKEANLPDAPSFGARGVYKLYSQRQEAHRNGDRQSGAQAHAGTEIRYTSTTILGCRTHWMLIPPRPLASLIVDLGPFKNKATLVLSCLTEIAEKVTLH
jgi:hypothetical protein